MTYAEAVAALTGKTYAGVRRVLGYEPSSVGAGDMPLLFPTLVNGRQAVAVFGGLADLPTLRVTLVLLIESMQSGTAQSRFERGVAFLDVLQAALLVDANTTGVDNVALRLEQLPIGETVYWAIVAEVEVSG